MAEASGSQRIWVRRIWSGTAATTVLAVTALAPGVAAAYPASDLRPATLCRAVVAYPYAPFMKIRETVTVEQAWRFIKQPDGKYLNTRKSGTVDVRIDADSNYGPIYRTDVRVRWHNRTTLRSGVATGSGNIAGDLVYLSVEDVTTGPGDVRFGFDFTTVGTNTGSASWNQHASCTARRDYRVP